MTNSKPQDPYTYNQEAWDRQVDQGNPWTIPVSPEVISEARQGRWSVVLTENVPVPRDWFPQDLQGVELLCLASGGGQQGPVFAAAGAKVTVLDASARQLAQDRFIAMREDLPLRTIQGDMRDLSTFSDSSFDLVFHPVSNLFSAEIRPVWREAYRVLRSGGILLAGFMNPVFYIFDLEKADQGILEVRYSIPYSDLNSLSPEQLQRFLASGGPVEYGHSLTDQIGGQLDVGFLLAGFYEDVHKGMPQSKIIPTYIATRAIKP